MKKFFAIAAIAVSIVACNNSGKTTKEEEKKIADSIEQKRIADSIAAATPAMPTPEEIEAKRIADSTRVADSLKNIK
jgi:hypothetical protein